MKITPRSEQEISELGVLPEGQYDFEVIEAKEEISKKAGNEMLHLVCRVWPEDGNAPVRVHDYLLDVPFKTMAQKVRHFCEVMGLEEEYQRGTLTADAILGRGGRCDVGIQKDKTGEHEDRNVILDYLSAVTAIAPLPIGPAVSGLPGDQVAASRKTIPF